MFGERQQGGESFSTDGAHVVFGGAAVRLRVLPQAALGEEGAGADVALVVPLTVLSRGIIADNRLLVLLFKHLWTVDWLTVGWIFLRSLWPVHQSSCLKD